MNSQQLKKTESKRTLTDSVQRTVDALKENFKRLMNDRPYNWRPSNEMFAGWLANHTQGEIEEALELSIDHLDKKGPGEIATRQDLRAFVCHVSQELNGVKPFPGERP